MGEDTRKKCVTTECSGSCYSKPVDRLESTGLRKSVNAAAAISLLMTSYLLVNFPGMTLWGVLPFHFSALNNAALTVGLIFISLAITGIYLCERSQAPRSGAAADSALGEKNVL
jgi:hypothetical protein